MVPVSLRLGYILYSGKYKFLPRGALEVATEPFVSPITSVEAGKNGSIEMGLALPMFTYHFDMGNHLVPYIEGGVGLLYTDLSGFRLGGHFQFLSQAGAGLSYFLTDNTALNLSWRFRHISNAGLYDDNVGFNSYIFQAGFSYFLPVH
jgi:opacity protein-like surface antigen